MMEVVFHKGDIYLCTKGKVCVFEIYNIYELKDPSVIDQLPNKIPR